MGEDGFRRLLDALAGKRAPRKHQFWNTQPVFDTQEVCGEEGPIDSEPRLCHAPVPAPEGLAWTEVDIQRSLGQVYELLAENYVEDLDSTFRFDYTAEFLRWYAFFPHFRAFTPPGWRPSWIIGLKGQGDRLEAFITAVPMELVIKGRRVRSAEVNFLCIRKEHRSKRIAPLLIREITRRVNLEGIFQALYTSGTAITKPFSEASYYHRPIHVGRLLDLGFIDGEIPDLEPPKERVSLRRVTAADIPTIKRLLDEHNAGTALYISYCEDELAHWLLPRDHVMHSYITIDGKAFAAFYELGSRVLNNPGQVLKAAFLYAYASQDGSYVELIESAMAKAVEMSFDVFNCLKIDRGEDFLQALHFMEGDGILRYYLYNWNAAPVRPESLAVVML